MKLYAIDRVTKQLTTIPPTDVWQAGMMETSDIEAWLRSSADLFDTKILWICRQDRPSDVERVDLVGLSGDVLYVAELKRGEVGVDAITQALGYTAHYAAFDRGNLANLYVSQAQKTGEWALLSKPQTEEEAVQTFDDVVEDKANLFQTILLVGTGFTPETLKVANYLNSVAGADGQLSIECWQLHLFQEGEGDTVRYFCSLEKVLPSVEIEDLIESRREERLVGKYKRDPDRIAMVKLFKDRVREAGFTCRGIQGRSYSCFPEIREGIGCEFNTDDGVWLGFSRDLKELKQIEGWNDPSIIKRVTEDTVFWLKVGENDFSTPESRETLSGAAIAALQGIRAVLTGVPE
jgi:hypothetical protein